MVEISSQPCLITGRPPDGTLVMIPKTPSGTHCGTAICPWQVEINDAALLSSPTQRWMEAWCIDLMGIFHAAFAYFVYISKLDADVRMKWIEWSGPKSLLFIMNLYRSHTDLIFIHLWHRSLCSAAGALALWWHFSLGWLFRAASL